MAKASYAELVAKGCTCGGRDSARCPLHPDPGDNRGLRAWLESGGVFRDFPMENVTCGACGHQGCLMYPDPFMNDGDGHEHRPSTVCPNCSAPANESFLRYRAEEQGFDLKPVCVFTTATRLLAESSTSSRLGEPGPGWEPITDPDEYLRALANLGGAS